MKKGYELLFLNGNVCWATLYVCLVGRKAPVGGTTFGKLRMDTKETTGQ